MVGEQDVQAVPARHIAFSDGIVKRSNGIHERMCHQRDQLLTNGASP